MYTKTKGDTTSNLIYTKKRHQNVRPNHIKRCAKVKKVSKRSLEGKRATSCEDYAHWMVVASTWPDCVPTRRKLLHGDSASVSTAPANSALEFWMRARGKIRRIDRLRESRTTTCPEMSPITNSEPSRDSTILDTTPWLVSGLSRSSVSAPCCCSRGKSADSVCRRKNPCRSHV